MPRRIRPEDAPDLLNHLERLGQTLKVQIRYEPLGEEAESTRVLSGLCRVQGEAVLFVDNRLSVVDKCQVLLAEFGRFDLGGVFVPPLVRRLLERSDWDTD